MQNKYISPQKALLMLEHLKMTKQYFCFTAYNEFYTAEELLSAIKGREVTADETLEYLTQ